LARLWIELGRKSESQDTFIRLIIVERIVKSAILLGFAAGLIVLGRTGVLYQWEVVHKVTLFRAGGLALNVAVVAYLAYKKRLFVDL
jgi:hypothetical protein